MGQYSEYSCDQGKAEDAANDATDDGSYTIALGCGGRSCGGSTSGG